MRKARYVRTGLLLLVGLLFLPALAFSAASIFATDPLPAARAAARPDASAPPAHRAGGCTAGSHGPAFGGTIVIDMDQVLCSDLTTFGAQVVVKGEVRGDILAFGSNIDISGNVSGNINLYGGVATVQDDSNVHGNINLFGGSIRQGQHMQHKLNVHNHGNTVWGGNSFREFSFPLWPMLMWVALGLLLTSLLPEHVMFVRATAVGKTRRSLLLGLLTLVLTPAVLLVLVALILPIPLAIIVAIGLIAAWALGTVAVGWLAGEQILRAIAPRYNTRPAQITVGLAALALLGALPYIGWLISLVAGILGVGAVLLSRFGTRLVTPPRAPLTL